MKNTIKTFALFLTAGAMLASCDSYLDRQPDEPLTSDNIFKKQKTTLQYLTNIYSYQPDYEAPACVSSYNDIPWEACSDETSFAYLDRSYTQINYNSWNPSLPIYRDDTYNTPYKGIREANYFMQNVHKCPPEELNDVDKGYYYNEARFLRAHFYAMMLPVYGPVFLIGDDPVDFTQSGLDQRERNTWDECVNYVANELWEAAKGLPDSWPDIYYGRATKGAALAARARLLLYSARKLFNGNELYKGIVNKNGDHLFPTQYDEKKWELAAQAAKDVMNLNLYSLVGADGTDPYASFNTLFTSVGSGTGGATEKIYTRIASGYQWRVVTTPPSVGGTAYGGYGVTQKQVDAFAMANGRYPITGYTDGDQARPIIDPDAGYSESGFSKFKHPIYGDELETFKMYQNREPRFYVNVFWSGMTWHGANKKTANVQFYFNGNSGPGKSHNYPPTGYLAHKFTNPSIDTSTGNWGYLDFPVFRYAEILLNYVEALNEYDPSNADITLYLNMIRKRAGVPDIEEVYPDAVGDQTRMRELIRRERQVELCFENLRYFDTRTWMTAETDNNMPVYGMNISAKDHKANGEFWQRVICKYDGGRDGNRVFTKRCYLFPISQEELDRVKCTQNYGW